MSFTGYSYAPGLAILSGAVDSINKRADEDDKKQTLAALGGQVANGDFDSAAKSAFAAGDAATGLGILKMKQEATTNKMWGGIADSYAGQGAPAAPTAGMTMGALNGDTPAGPAAPSFAGGKTAMQLPADPDIENRFVSTLKAGGLTNPNGLAAVAAYANAESRYSPQNITGSWADPSQSGQPGTSGGILSWRADRLANMRQATAGAPDPVAAQAKFMLTENPDLTVALQNAKSPEEAHSLMANAWKFAGYDQPGGENARRLGLTQAYVGRLASIGGDPTQTPATPAAGTLARSLFAGGAPADSAPAQTASIPLPPSRPVQVASADPSFVPQPSTMSNGAAPAVASAPPSARLAVPPAGPLKLDPGSTYRLTEGAKVNPNAPAIAYASPNDVQANPGAFYNPDGSRKTAGEVFATLNGGATPAPAPQGSGAAPPQAASAQVPQAVQQQDAPAAPKYGSVPIPMAQVRALQGTPDTADTRAAFDGTYGEGASQRILGPVKAAPPAPAATPAAPIQTAAIDPSDPPVTIPGFKGTWTRAAAAKTDPNDTSTPDADDVAQAQKAAGPGAGASAAAAPVAAPAAASTQVAQASGTPAAAAPMQIQPRAISPQAAAQLQATPSAGAPQQRALVSMLLRDPSTRAAGIQAMMTLSKSDGWDLKTVGDQTVLFRGGANPSIVPLQGFGKAPEAKTVGDSQYWLRPGEMPSDANRIGDAKGSKETDTTLIKDYAAYKAQETAEGRAPLSMFDYQIATKRAGANSINNNIGKGETKEAEALGTERGKRAAVIETAGASAPEQIAKLNLLGSLLERADTGALGGAEATVAGWSQALGVDPAKLGLNPNQAITAQAAQKITNELVVGSIGKGGFPANNFSDADRGFLEKMFPSIANRPEANKIAIDVMRRVEQRKMETADAWSQYQQDQHAAGKTPSVAEFEFNYRKQLRSQPEMFADLRKQIEAMPAVGPPKKYGDPSLPQISTPDGVALQQGPDTAATRADFDKKYGIGASQRVLKTPAPPAPKSVVTPADYDALVAGDRYTDPDGNVRTKK